MASAVAKQCSRILSHRFVSQRVVKVYATAQFSSNSSQQETPPIPVYKWTPNESLENRRARLLYQSRKRGMLENGLLLSTFAAKYLDSLNEQQLKLYDELINLPSNDWDIYYWMTGAQPTPVEFDHEVMNMMKRHAKNEEREERLHQPGLNPPS